MVNTHCTFGEFKKLHPEITAYRIRAFEDIEGGFAKSGHSIYGDCNDLVVKTWDTPFTDTLTIYLGNKVSYKERMHINATALTVSQSARPVQPVLMFRFTGTVQELRDYLSWCRSIKRELSKQPKEKS